MIDFILCKVEGVKQVVCVKPQISKTPTNTQIFISVSQPVGCYVLIQIGAIKLFERKIKRFNLIAVTNSICLFLVKLNETKMAIAKLFIFEIPQFE